MQTTLSTAAFPIAVARGTAQPDVRRSPEHFQSAARPDRSLTALLAIGLLAVGLLVAGIGMAAEIGRGVGIAERCDGACTEVPVAAGAEPLVGR